MIFLGLWNVYALRVNLSVGIVAMTENRTVHYSNGTIGYVSITITNNKAYILLLKFKFVIGLCLGNKFRLEFQTKRTYTKCILLWIYLYTISWRLYIIEISTKCRM